MSDTILQFGTSRFLQAHVDLILSEAAAAGQNVLPITVVETTGSPASQARVAAFDRGAGFDVRIRGRTEGRDIDETRRVSSVTAGISARREPDRLLRAFVDEAVYIISNTGDRGFDLPERPDPSAWRTFPELLTHLLHARFVAGRPGLTVMPCELVSSNGAVLQDIVLGLAGAMDVPGFTQWLRTDCLWCNALVDRIVSEPLDPLGAVAEPYALWAIEDRPGFSPPCAHPSLHVVGDLTPITRRKLFLLNLGHTILAQRWQNECRAADETVRAIMADRDVRRWLCAFMDDEIIPAFGPEIDAARAYWQVCLDRFDNPFLDHRIADIAQNHAAKVDRRAGGLLRWAGINAAPGVRALFPQLGAVDDVRHAL